MSYFRTILNKRCLDKHDARVLWKYYITDEEYLEIKQSVASHLQNKTLYDYPIDAALYVAEWWRRDYIGGIPSWASILNEINLNEEFSDDFQKACKKAIEVLNIPVIQLKNRHFLQTLLNQGGLPIQRIVDKENVGAYTNYILALYSRVKLFGESQVREDENLKSENYLPQTFRNSIISDISFEIVKALINDEPNLLPFKLEEELSNKFWETLIENKANIKANFTEVFLQWNLYLNSDLPEEDAKIGLVTLLKEYIDKDTQEHLKIEKFNGFNVFINDHSIGSYSKTVSGSFKLMHEQKAPIMKGILEDVECYGVGDSQKQITLPVNGSLPNFDFPILLEEIEDSSDKKKFVMHSKNTIKSSKGFILVPKAWEPKSPIEFLRKVTYGDYLWSLYSFEGDIELVSDSTSITYRTNVSISENLILTSPRLAGIKHSSIPIIFDKPNFKIINELYESESVKQESIEIYDKKDREWKPLSSNSFGKITCRVKTKESLHFTKFYRVPNETKISINPKGATSGEINIKGIGGIVSSDIQCKIYTSNGEIRLEYNLKVGEEIPSKIKLTLESSDSRDRISFDVLAPFVGAYFKSAKQERLAHSTILCPTGLEGYRIIAVGGDYSLLIESTLNNNLKLTKRISSINGERSIIEFIDEIYTMLSLQSTLEDSNTVTLSIIDQNSSPISAIKIQRFNAYEYEKSDCSKPSICIVGINKKPIADNLKLKAFQLLGSLPTQDVSNVDLVWNGTDYIFPESTPSGNWIVYSDYTTEYTFKPCLRILSNENSLELKINTLEYAISIPDKKQRYDAIQKILVGDSDIQSSNWKCIVFYLIFAIENKIPLDVMDYFKVIFANPVLAIRLFLSLQFQKSDEDEQYILKIVTDQNFSWRLIPILNWNEELINLNNSSLYESIIKIKLIVRVFNFLKSIYSDFPIINFIQDPNTRIDDPGSLDRDWIKDLKVDMGTQQWPHWSPDIEQEWSQLLPISKGEELQKGLLLAPLKAALMVSGYSSDYWNDSQGSSIRYICYYRNLNQKWFDRAFSYFLKKIISRRGIKQ